MRTNFRTWYSFWFALWKGTMELKAFYAILCPRFLSHLRRRLEPPSVHDPCFHKDNDAQPSDYKLQRYNNLKLGQLWAAWFC